MFLARRQAVSPEWETVMARLDQRYQRWLQESDEWRNNWQSHVQPPKEETWLR